jgi:hypothetical protein
MATYSALEFTKGTDSGSKHNLSNGTTTYQAKRRWTILASEAATAESAPAVRRKMQSAGVLPREGISHPDNGFVFCVGVKVTQESPILYQAEAMYESVPVENGGGGGGGEEPTSPLDVAVSIEWSSITTTGTCSVDADGNDFKNPGTGEPWQGVTRRYTDISAVLTKPFVAFSGPVIRQYCDHVNDRPFLGFPAGEAMVDKIRARPASYENIKYYNVTAEILFRTPFQVDSVKAWYWRQELYGKQFVDSNGKIANANDDYDGPGGNTVRIGFDGKKLLPSQETKFDERRLYEPVNFSEMGFGI